MASRSTVGTKIDSRGTNKRYERDTESDQGIAHLTRSPIRREEICQQAKPIDIVHDMTTGKAWLVDHTCDCHKLPGWTRTFNEMFDNPIEYVGGTGKQDKDGF